MRAGASDARRHRSPAGRPAVFPPACRPLSAGV